MECKYTIYIWAGCSGHFFHIFENKLFCLTVAVSDLVHVVEAIHDLCLLLTTSGNLF